MRTGATMEDRQANLSVKAAGAADLLRTRVHVEIERQNHGLLHALDERTRPQLRLQCTAEGLSVEAIGYPVVSLFGYLPKVPTRSDQCSDREIYWIMWPIWEACSMDKPAVTIDLSAEERRELENLAGRRRAAQGLARRARIVLLAADGLENKDICEELDVVRTRLANGAGAMLRAALKD